MGKSCCVKTCKINGAKHKGISFYRIPAVITYQCEKTARLSQERRLKWLQALKITPQTYKGYFTVCSRHFHSGQPAKLMDNSNVDWVPSLLLENPATETAPTKKSKRKNTETEDSKRPKLSETTQNHVVELPGPSQNQNFIMTLNPQFVVYNNVDASISQFEPQCIIKEEPRSPNPDIDEAILPDSILPIENVCIVCNNRLHRTFNNMETQTENFDVGTDVSSFQTESVGANHTESSSISVETATGVNSSDGTAVANESNVETTIVEDSDKETTIVEDADKETTIAEDADKETTIAEDADKETIIAEDLNKETTIAEDSSKEITIVEDFTNETNIAEDSNKGTTVGSDSKVGRTIATYSKTENTVTKTTIKDNSTIATTTSNNSAIVNVCNNAVNQPESIGNRSTLGNIPFFANARNFPTQPIMAIRPATNPNNAAIPSISNLKFRVVSKRNTNTQTTVISRRDIECQTIFRVCLKFELESAQFEIEKLKNQMQAFDHTMEKNKKLSDAAQNLLDAEKKKTSILEEQLCFRRFGEDFFRDSNDKVEFFTGLKSFDKLTFVVNEIGLQLFKSSKLSPFQQCVMTLIKFSLAPNNKLLMYLFDVSTTTVLRIFMNCLNALYDKFNKYVEWPDRKLTIDKSTPKPFKDKFGKGKLVTIIDYLEVDAVHRKVNKDDEQTPSNAKHNTIKYLIAFTPLGAITYVSKGWDGQVTFRDLILQCGLLDKLQSGDIILSNRRADTGELGFYCAKVNKNLANQLEPNDFEAYRYIKIQYVDKVIGYLRRKYAILESKFHIFVEQDLNQGECSIVDKMVCVACALNNLCPTTVLQPE